MTRVDHYHDPNAPQPTSIKVAVSAFVLDDHDRLLIIQRSDNDLYSVPGGQVEPGETLTQATVREVREETGVDVEVTGLIGLYSNPAHVIAYDDGEARQEFSICFRAQPVGGQLQASDESTEVDWIERNRLPDLNIHPSIRLRIDHGYQDRAEPYYT